MTGKVCFFAIPKSDENIARRMRLTTMVSQTLHRKFAADTSLVVYAPAYLKKLNDLIAVTPKKCVRKKCAMEAKLSFAFTSRIQDEIRKNSFQDTCKLHGLESGVFPHEFPR